MKPQWLLTPSTRGVASTTLTEMMVLSILILTTNQHPHAEFLPLFHAFYNKRVIDTSNSLFVALCRFALTSSHYQGCVGRCSQALLTGVRNASSLREGSRDKKFCDYLTNQIWAASHLYQTRVASRLYQTWVASRLYQTRVASYQPNIN